MGTATEVKHLRDMTMAELEAEFDRAMAETSLARVNTCIHAAAKAVDNESRIREASTVVASLEFLMGTYRRISTRFGNSGPGLDGATKKLFRQIRVIIIKHYTVDAIAIPLWVKNGAVTRHAMLSRRDQLVTAFFAEYGFAGLDSKDMAGIENYLRGLWQKRESNKATDHAPVELIKTTISAGAFGLLTHFRVLEAIPYIFGNLVVESRLRGSSRTAFKFTDTFLSPLPAILEPADREQIELVCATILCDEGRCNPHPSDEVFRGARALLELLAQYTLYNWESGQVATAATHPGL